MVIVRDVSSFMQNRTIDNIPPTATYLRPLLCPLCSSVDQSRARGYGEFPSSSRVPRDRNSAKQRTCSFHVSIFFSVLFFFGFISLSLFLSIPLCLEASFLPHSSLVAIGSGARKTIPRDGIVSPVARVFQYFEAIKSFHSRVVDSSIFNSPWRVTTWNLEVLEFFFFFSLQEFPCPDEEYWSRF